MKNPLYQALVIMVILLTVLAACAPSATSAPVATTEAPKPAATTAPTAEPTKPPLPTNTSAPAIPKNAVTSLEDVKNATIQIESEGTFIDPQVGMVVNGAGRGSGFIVDSSGIAVTNNHVVTGAALLKVWVGGNKDKVYSAKVLGASECSDLAVIKITGSDFPYLQWHEGTPNVGLDIYAAGYPLGDPEFTLTKGIVSKAKADGETNWASIGTVLEHDARINPGNSGGPLVDKEGKVVGINYASNSSNQYFAIARAEADQVIKDLEGGTDVTSIGVNGQAIITDDRSLSGVWVSSVKSGTPADRAGLKAGDIIVQMEGLVLSTDGTMSDYCQILRSHKASDTLTLNVLRWQTQEILEGQLNGRRLKVTGTFGGGSGTSSTPEPGGGTVTVTDDSNVISMAVPSDWEYNGKPWNDAWTIGNNSYDFIAQTLTVSPNVSDYTNGWDTKGVFIATSVDWANIGGYNNLLVAVSDFYSDCQPSNAKTLNDTTNTYEGQYIIYTRCGTPKSNAMVLAVRPKSDPQAYMVLIEMKYATDAEFDEVNTIFSTADVNP